MIYIDPSGSYPRFKGDIKIAVKEWAEGLPLPEGWLEVAKTPLPKIKLGETYGELFPELVDGVYYQRFDVRAVTAQEIELQEQLRKELEEEKPRLGK